MVCDKAMEVPSKTSFVRYPSRVSSGMTNLHDHDKASQVFQHQLERLELLGGGVPCLC